MRSSRVLMSCGETQAQELSRRSPVWPLPEPPPPLSRWLHFVLWSSPVSLPASCCWMTPLTPPKRGCGPDYRGSPSLPAAVLADVVLPLSDLWGILENAEGVSLPQWDSSLGKSPLIMYFFPCYGSQSSLRPSCFRWAKDSFRIKRFLHFLHHELFSVSVSPTPTSVYWGERTLVPGYFSAVYLLKFHFMGVVVVWQSLLWVQCRLVLGPLLHLHGLFFPPLFFFFMCVCVCNTGL